MDIQCRKGNEGESIDSLVKANFDLHFRNGSFNPGYTNDYWWIKVNVTNNGRAATKYILLNNPHVNHITVLDPTSKTRLQLGDKNVFGKRPVNYSDFAIPLDLAANEHRTIFIGVDKIGESLQIKVDLADAVNLERMINMKMLTTGLIMGWMLLIVFIVMLIWFYTKERSNLFYSAYIISITLWIFSNTGVGFQLLWPRSYEFNNISRPFFLFCAACFFALTLLTYFKENNFSRITRKALKVQIFSSILMIMILTLVNVNQIPINYKFKFLILVPVLIGIFALTSFLHVFANWRASTQFSGFYFFGMIFFLSISICQNLFQFGLNTAFLEFINIHGPSISLVGETSIIGAGFVFKFNKEKESVQAELMAQRFALSKEIINIQELERKRIGQDLHDSIGGLLATLKIYLVKAGPDAANIYLNNCKKILEQCVHEIRIIIDNLVPQNIHLHGFSKAFELFIAYSKGSTDANIIFYHEIKSKLSISSQTVLYRILTELLNNCIKHAKSSEINISIIEEKEEIRILFEDNGVGFTTNTENNGHGLKNVLNRVKFLNGTMHTESSRDGTTIIIQVPVLPHLFSNA
ncbi:MAG: 7TM diverse intracellular signaling domain-containing protein [bacterium]